MKLRTGALVALFIIGSMTAATAAPAYDWNGFYAGLNVGIDWTSAQQNPFSDQVQQFSNAFIPGRGIVVVPGTTVPGPSADRSGSRAAFGGQVGFSHMVDNWVLGVEGDVNAISGSANFSITNNLPLTAIAALGTATDARRIDIDTAWSARLRAGYAWDCWQLYLTGGVAGAVVSVSALGTYVDLGGAAAPNPLGPQTFNAPLTNTTAGFGSSQRVGWTLGGGGEIGLTDYLSIGLEYRHTDLGPKTIGLTNSDVAVSNVTITAPAGSSNAGSLPPKLILSASSIRNLTTDALTARFNIRL